MARVERAAPVTWWPWLATVVRLGLAAVLVWAAVPKIANPAAAVISVRAYQLLPETAVHAVAWGLPFVELAVALLLLTAGLLVWRPVSRFALLRDAGTEPAGGSP